MELPFPPPEWFIIASLFIAGVVTPFFLVVVNRGFGLRFLYSGLAMTGAVVVIALFLGRDDGGRTAANPDLFLTRDGLAAIANPGSGWKQLPVPMNDMSLLAANPETHEFLAVVAHPKKKFPKGFSVENYADSVTKTLSNDLTDVTVYGIFRTEINGMPAYRCLMSGHFGSVENHYLNTFIEGRDHFYELRSWVRHDIEQAAMPRLRRVSASFHEFAGTEW